MLFSVVCTLIDTRRSQVSPREIEPHYKARALL